MVGIELSLFPSRWSNAPCSPAITGHSYIVYSNRRRNCTVSEGRCPYHVTSSVLVQRRRLAAGARDLQFMGNHKFDAWIGTYADNVSVERRAGDKFVINEHKY